MMLAALLILGFCGQAWTASVIRAPVVSGCSIDLNKNLPTKNDPILLKRGNGGKLELVFPEFSGQSDVIPLRSGEEVIVACPGNKNKLEVTKAAASSSSCIKDSAMNVDGKKYDMTELECSSKSTASLLNTKKSCASGKGVLVQMGYEVDSWISLAEACHNLDEASTFYATHTLYGPYLAGKVNQAFRPGFSRGDKEFFKGFNPDQAYNQKNQEEAFAKLLGPKSAKKYLQASKTTFLARGHLAPDADFIYGSWQLLTYFYINAAPQWQSINAGYWLGVENNMRKVAQKLGANLDIATGTYGILKLKDDTNKEQQVYLQGGRLPVPELYWKAAHNPQDDSCIAVISTNNPFLTEPPKTICKDICQDYGWPSLTDDLSHGYVYCCNYRDFKKAVSYAPDYKCESVLKF